LGWDSRLLTSVVARQAPEFAVHFGDWVGLHEDGSIQVVTDHDGNAFSHRRRTMKSVAQLVQDSEIVVFPEGDHSILPWLSLMSRPRNLNFIVMRGISDTAVRPWKRFVKRSIIGLGRWQGGRIVELVSALAPAGSRNSENRYVRDLVPRMDFPDTDLARRTLGVEKTGQVFLLAGKIDARKSPREIVHWIGSSTLRPAPQVLVVGKIDDECKECFYGPMAQRLARNGQLTIIDNYVDEETLRAAYAAADAVLVLYSNDAPSGVVAFSVMAQRPLLVWNNKSSLADIDRLGIGAQVHERSPAGLDSAARELEINSERVLINLSTASQSLNSSFFAEVTGMGTYAGAKGRG
jgi:hypothetical protein